MQIKLRILFRTPDLAEQERKMITVFRSLSDKAKEYVIKHQASEAKLTTTKKKGGQWDHTRNRQKNPHTLR